MSELSLRETFGNYLLEVSKENKDIVVLNADLSSSTGTLKFSKLFPERFFNMGVAEQNMLGSALGFAISGKIPVVSGFSLFTIGRAWEFIRLACHDKLNVKIITTHGGFVGEDGSTHNALGDLSLMATLPNLKIFVPLDNIDLLKILEYSLDIEGPIYIRLPRGSFPKIHDVNYKFLLGNPDVLKEGNDICIIGTGYGSILAIQSALKLEEELKLSIKVVNISNIKPINEKLIVKEIKDIKGIIIIEEHNIYCGFGSIISRIISENSPIPIKFIGIRNSFGESGERETLLNHYGYNLENIKKQIKEIYKIILR